ncbi:alkaline phosphatase family protein [Portibacter marinus]|uniref:alkaline phosphatase family protein n=1 Tax=Portibacter marinus TaxID=2898660 RepID=UPI001F1F696B|nr:alkaline phosphatase family protein [Portibacter marinus]
MKRLSIISLDGVNWDIIQPLLDGGKLPFLSKLMQKGSQAVLQTHSYVSSGSTWPSIHTGTHPGEHGIMFSHRQLESGTYNIVKKQAEDIPFKGFWQVASKSGIPTIAIDLPKAPAVRQFNGLVLNSWGEEAPWYSPSFPKDLKKEIHSKFGKHPLQEFYHRPMKDLNSWKWLKNQHVIGLKKRFEIAHYLMDQQADWQLFVMAINEMHLAGHLFWHIIDEDHPDHDPELRQEVGNIMQELLIITDRGLATLADRTESNQLIISNNGMDRSQAPMSVLDQVLKRLGYMHGEVNDDKNLGRNSFNVVQELEKKIPMGLVQWLKAKAPKKLWYKITRKLTYSTNEWKKSRAFPVPNDVSGAIRINLRGREPHGIVDPKEYDTLCQSIIEDMNQLTINQTDTKAIEKVIKVKDQFNGQNSNELADLLILWNKEKPIISVESPKIGTVKVKEDKRTGAHTDKGIFVADEMMQGLFKREGDMVHDLQIYPAVLNFFEIEPKLKINNTN